MPKDIEIVAESHAEFAAILTPAALDFVASLQREFGERRETLLRKRVAHQESIDAGERPDFLAKTAAVRTADWRVAEPPPDMQKLRLEITGPVDRKMIINALNSGANCFMADFEDANSPTWENNIRGQINLRDAVAETIAFSSPDGKQYRLNEETATLLVRPRGWHLEERHAVLDGQPLSASLFDFGLYLFHNARALLRKNTRPYFYLPKLESHLEARLWNDVFIWAQDALPLSRGTIRATVLIENLLAAFEMDEILYELREHSIGLNAGRWDYIFSAIRTLRNWPQVVFPDRSQITMTVPFMHAYTELLVQTCHRRGAHAIGGMSAFIPNRRDSEVTEIALENVRKDKEREAAAGFDGTWVAHPDLVPVAQRAFSKHVRGQTDQRDRMRAEVNVSAENLLDVKVPGGEITETGLRLNINVALQYLAAWLGGLGCVPILNLMEDTATAEISRAQLWQWLHHPEARTAEGDHINAPLYQRLADEELRKTEALAASIPGASERLSLARELLDELVTQEGFVDFLTLVAYERLPDAAT